MPTFQTLTDADVQKLDQRRNNLEGLSEYLKFLDSLKEGDWGSVQLQGDESSRMVKRRTTVAAHSQGKEIRWRPGRTSNPPAFVFQVMSAEQQSNGSRPRGRRRA